MSHVRPDLLCDGSSLCMTVSTKHEKINVNVQVCAGLHIHMHKYIYHGQSKQSPALSLKIGFGQIICFSLFAFKIDLKDGQWSSTALTGTAFMQLCWVLR